MKKIRHYLQEQIKNDGDAETIQQLERILTIRKNRQERLESKTRELRRNLAEKENELQAERAQAAQFEDESKSTINALRETNTQKALTVNEIFHWKNKEIDLNKKVKKTFERCDEIEEQKNMEIFKLDSHLRTYKQAVIDVEKIALIKDEIEEKQKENP